MRVTSGLAWFQNRMADGLFEKARDPEEWDAMNFTDMAGELMTSAEVLYGELCLPHANVREIPLLAANLANISFLIAERARIITRAQDRA